MREGEGRWVRTDDWLHRQHLLHVAELLGIRKKDQPVMFKMSNHGFRICLWELADSSQRCMLKVLMKMKWDVHRVVVISLDTSRCNYLCDAKNWCDRFGEYGTLPNADGVRQVRLQAIAKRDENRARLKEMLRKIDGNVEGGLRDIRVNHMPGRQSDGRLKR